MSARLIKKTESTASIFAPFAWRAMTDSATPAELYRTQAEAISSSQAAIFPSRNANSEEHDALDEAETSILVDTLDAEEEATSIIAAARREAERLVGEANARTVAIELAAQERGLTAAREEIALEVAQAVEPLRARLTATFDELQILRANIAQRAERDLVRLALEIARKIVHREISIDPDITLALARVALSRLHDGTSSAVARVHLHPDDLAYIQTHQAQLETSGHSVELVPDRSVESGGCIVRTEMGDIDARIGQQFTEIERGFLKA